MMPTTRWKEEIKGGILSTDGEQFFVVGRKSLDVLFPGMVYVFLQDKSDTVWMIDDVGQTGFFKKKLAVTLHAKAGTKKTCAIADFREAQSDEVLRCLSMANNMRGTLDPLLILTDPLVVSFLWSPYLFQKTAATTSTEEATGTSSDSEIKGVISCEDGAVFLVVARRDERLRTRGKVYVRVGDREAHYIFLQDRTAKVWQITSFSSVGAFEQKQVVGLVSQGGDLRDIVIGSIREAVADQVATCIAMAVHVSKGPIAMLTPEFRWMPYAPSDARATFEQLR